MRFILLIALATVLAAPAVAQPIYKVVDEDGNVTYTDQKPSDDAEPEDLPEINVLSTDDEETSEILEGAAAPEAGDADEREPLGFRFEIPSDGQTIESGGDGLPIELNSNVSIPATALIVLYLNDQPQPPIQTLEATLDDIGPGAHRLRAELQTAGGRVLAETETIEFVIEPEPGAPETGP